MDIFIINLARLNIFRRGINVKIKIKRLSYIKRNMLYKNYIYIDILLDRNSILLERAINKLQSEIGESK